MCDLVVCVVPVCYTRVLCLCVCYVIMFVWHACVLCRWDSDRRPAQRCASGARSCGGVAAAAWCGCEHTNSKHGEFVLSRMWNLMAAILNLQEVSALCSLF